MSEDNPYAAPQSQIVPPPPPPLPSDQVAKALTGLQYPLTLSFKILALTTQANVTDASGRTVLHTKQKFFKFKEHVEIFADSTRSTRLADIKTNKVIDWSARYFMTDASGGAIGSVGRRGWRSIWKAHYESFNPGDETPDFSIHEENPGAKVADAILGEIPIVGMLTGYLFHPRYLASRSSGEAAMRMTKKPAFFEGRFQIDKVGDLTPREEMNLILSFMMLVILERRRG